MIALPPELQSYLALQIWQAAIVFFRVGALVSLLPAFGEQSVPMRVRLCVALVFTMIITPAIAPSVVDDAAAGPELLRFLLTETLIGLALGIGVRLFVLTLQTAGSIAAQSTSLAQVLGGAGVEPAPAMGHLLMIAGLALAVTAGLHVQAARLLIESYQVFPVGFVPAAADLSAWGVARIARAFSLALGLAIPFVIASLIYNLTLGVINRAMPQLMVAFVGAPLITFGGLLLLFVSAPLLLTVWVNGLSAFMADPMAVPR